ncbi:MAG: leucine-rich repeat domain-containing protein, partial [Defluviitaleaceae bacterium]|nr:leucine-rich repeat domain-containing protein [Defluviitaleaceae bacterium]
MKRLTKCAYVALMAIILTAAFAACSRSEELPLEIETTEIETLGTETPEYITIRGEQLSTSLTELSTASLGWQLTDEELVPLRHMVNLESLDLYIEHLSDFEPISVLPNLTHLTLFVTTSDIDLAPLAALSTLTNLFNLQMTMWQVDIADIDFTPLAGLTNFTHFGMIIDSTVPIDDLSPVAVLTNLTWLSIWDARLTDITPIAGMSGLTHLDLPFSRITDISPLAGLTNLQSLHLSDNRISDITPLAGLT